MNIINLKQYFTAADPEWKSLIKDKNKFPVYSFKQKAYRFIEKDAVARSTDQNDKVSLFI